MNFTYSYANDTNDRIILEQLRQNRLDLAEAFKRMSEEQKVLTAHKLLSAYRSSGYMNTLNFAYQKTRLLLQKNTKAMDNIFKVLNKQREISEHALKELNTAMRDHDILNNDIMSKQAIRVYQQAAHQASLRANLTIRLNLSQNQLVQKMAQKAYQNRLDRINKNMQSSRLRTLEALQTQRMMLNQLNNTSQNIKTRSHVAGSFFNMDKSLKKVGIELHDQAKNDFILAQNSSRIFQKGFHIEQNLKFTTLEKSGVVMKFKDDKVSFKFDKNGNEKMQAEAIADAMELGKVDYKTIKSAQIPEGVKKSLERHLESIQKQEIINQVIKANSATLKEIQKAARTSRKLESQKVSQKDIKHAKKTFAENNMTQSLDILNQKLKNEKTAKKQDFVK